MTAAAVLGEDLDPTLLADVANLPPDVLSGHIAVLIRAGLLSVTGDTPPRYRLTHALVRDGVVAESGLATAESHQRAAVSLELRAGTDPAYASRIMAHWRRSGDDAEALRATVRWARVAAAHARQALVPEEAARLLGYALDAARRTHPGPGEYAELLIELATAECLAGLIPESSAHCRDAADAGGSGPRRPARCRHTCHPEHRWPGNRLGDDCPVCPRSVRARDIG